MREAEDEVLQKANKRMIVNRVRQQLLGGDAGSFAMLTRRKDMFELPELDQADVDDALDEEDDGLEHEQLKFTFVDTAVVDVFSEEFDALPLEIQHDIIVEMKERQKKKERHNYDPSATKFSTNQVLLGLVSDVDLFFQATYRAIPLIHHL